MLVRVYIYPIGTCPEYHVWGLFIPVRVLVPVVYRVFVVARLVLVHFLYGSLLVLYGISLYYYYNVGGSVCQGVLGGFVNFA